jgi:hypothetical protein
MRLSVNKFEMLFDNKMGIYKVYYVLFFPYFFTE